jgi:Asp-tRNA(Asn)/Glu-tRNA(Gln) amidotransferase A subunit family amidase
MRLSVKAVGCAAVVAAMFVSVETGRAQNGRRMAPAFDVMETSIDEIHAAFKAGTLTARALTQQYLDRIAAYNYAGPNLNAIITLSTHALADADALDVAYRQSGPVGPLHGIPILVKDEIDAQGFPTTLGTLVFKDYRPPHDSFVVAKLRAAGAVILGKTTLSEFAGGDTYGSMFGVTRNPYGLTRTVGGSSGGSGAAVAANFSTVALGEETSASIRRPGGWNSVVSLRPTPGLVSRSGMWDGYPRPQAQMGPMARSVRDLAELLDVMVGYDAEDPLTALGVGKAPAAYTASLDSNGLRGARIGVMRQSMGSASDAASQDFMNIDAVFQKNVEELKAAGAVLVDPIVIPDVKELMAVRGNDDESSDQALHLYLSRNPASPFKTRADIANSPDMAKSIPPTKANQWKNPRAASDMAQYALALKARDQLAINVAKVMADHQLDAIVYKTVEQSPPLIEEEINPPYKQGTAFIFNLNTFLVYAAAMNVPAGFTPDGLPVGITFFGRPYSEPTLLKLASGFEAATHHRAPPNTTPALPSHATN